MEKKPAHNPQRYRKSASSRFDSYERAKAFLGLMGDDKPARIRIRKREGGKFDLVVYELLPQVS